MGTKPSAFAMTPHAFCSTCRHVGRVDRMGFAVAVCGHPALQVADFVRGKTRPEYCDRLNKSGHCLSWEAKPPPEPSPEPVDLFDIEATSPFPTLLLVGVLLLAAGVAAFFGLK